MQATRPFLHIIFLATFWHSNPGFCPTITVEGVSSSPAVDIRGLHNPETNHSKFSTKGELVLCVRTLFQPGGFNPKKWRTLSEQKQLAIESYVGSASLYWKGPIFTAALSLPNELPTITGLQLIKKDKTTNPFLELKFGIREPKFATVEYNPESQTSTFCEICPGDLVSMKIQKEELPDIPEYVKDIEPMANVSCWTECSRDRRLQAIGLKDGSIIIFNQSQKIILLRLSICCQIKGGERAAIMAIGFSPDGQWFVTADSTRKIHFYSI